MQKRSASLQTKSNESQIQKAICDYLALRRYFFWRSNNIPISQIQDGKRIFRRMPNYGMLGVPDIIVIKNGLFFGLEVKDKSQQSDTQKKFEENCKKAGGYYHVVRSVTDVMDIGL